MGWREVVKIEKEVTKVVDGKEIVEKKKYFELSDYKYMSCLNVKTVGSEIGRGLVRAVILTHSLN